MKGFSPESLIKQFKATPHGYTMVIMVKRTMYAVHEINHMQIKVSKFSSLKVSDEKITADVPSDVIYYWYFPIIEKRLDLSKKDPDTEEKPKKEKKARVKNVSPRI